MRNPRGSTLISSAFRPRRAAITGNRRPALQVDHCNASRDTGGVADCHVQALARSGRWVTIRGLTAPTARSHWAARVRVLAATMINRLTSNRLSWVERHERVATVKPWRQEPDRQDVPTRRSPDSRRLDTSSPTHPGRPDPKPPFRAVGAAKPAARHGAADRHTMTSGVRQSAAAQLT